MKNTPEIRFSGFSDDWEQRKLGDLIEENLKPVPKPNGEYVRLGIRSHTKGTFYEVVAEGEGLDVDTMYIVEANNLIVNITFAWEEAWAITTEKDAKKLVSHRFPQYRFNDGQCPMFYQYRFRNSRMKYNLGLASPGGAGRNRVLNKTEFMKIPVIIPTSYEEQQQIGAFFSQLDTLLTLHQRKCEVLKKFKKSMLQKMFPQNGKRVPEVRFAGFTDDWEQRKFGSLIKEKREKTIIENEDTLLSCAIDGMFLNTELFSHFRGSSNIGYLKVKKNDLILSAQNLHLGNCNVNLRFETGIISPAYKTYELVDCNPYFIQAWVKQDSTKDFFLQATTEGASACRKNVVWEELYRQTLYIPGYEEQHQIGEFFSQLDTLLTLHQRKLEALQKLKKALLQKMFPFCP